MLQQRKRRREEERDRLSDLVDDLLSYIVSYLPVRDAVRTSTLSRRWRSIWTNPLRLVFKQHWSVGFRRREEEPPSSEEIHLAGIVSTTLLNHSDTPLRHCRITTHHPYSCSDDGVDPPVQLLSIYCLTGAMNCRLSPHAFSHFAHTLQELELTSCNLPDEPPFHGCVALRVLSLHYVHLSDKTLANIIANCFPLLESLILSACEKLSNPCVSSSNLKRLEMRNMKLKSIKIDTPALTTLTLLLYMGSRPCQMNPFPLLNRLYININLINIDQSMRLANFFQECSLLQEVRIKPGWGSSRRGNCWKSMMRSKEKFRAVLLEKVILEDFVNHPTRRFFLTFLLSMAAGLKRVEIWRKVDAPINLRLERFISRISMRFSCEINLQNRY